MLGIVLGQVLGFGNGDLEFTFGTPLQYFYLLLKCIQLISDIDENGIDGKTISNAQTLCKT